MTKLKRNLSGFGLILVASLFLASCASHRLESGGAYAPVGEYGTNTVAPDIGFFAVDSAYRIAYSSVDAIFQLEKDNRATLWKLNPEIKHTLDRIRPQAVEANRQYIVARKVYISKPTPANLDIMSAVLAKIQQLTATATAVIPKGP